MTIGVIGAGSWGTALAIASARGGNNVIIWSRHEDVANDINNNHLNSKYLGLTSVHENIKATITIEDLFSCDVILLAIPAQSLRDGIKDYLIPSSIPLVICSKGVEQSSLALMSEVVADYFKDNPIAILSGPNFSDEIANGLPACATLACANKAAADKIISLLGNKLLRLYYSGDVIGAQIGGAVKNVIAIACGIAIGKGLGENARAALVTRGITEIVRLCIKMGGRQETLMGLSGIGDIMLTCGSEKSRNMYMGVQIGKGIALDILMANGKTVEGVATSKSVADLAEKLGVDMPITNAVKRILHENASIENTIKALLERPFAVEGN